MPPPPPPATPPDSNSLAALAFSSILLLAPAGSFRPRALKRKNSSFYQSIKISAGSLSSRAYKRTYSPINQASGDAADSGATFCYLDSKQKQSQYLFFLYQALKIKKL